MLYTSRLKVYQQRVSKHLTIPGCTWSFTDRTNSVIDKMIIYAIERGAATRYNLPYENDMPYGINGISIISICALLNLIFVCSHYIFPHLKADEPFSSSLFRALLSCKLPGAVLIPIVPDARPSMIPLIPTSQREYLQIALRRKHDIYFFQLQSISYQSLACKPSS